jgi:hypothetical protein
MAEHQLDDPLLVALRRARPRGGDDAVADGPKARDLLERLMADGLVAAAPGPGRHEDQRVESEPPAPPCPAPTRWAADGSGGGRRWLRSQPTEALGVSLGEYAWARTGRA